LFPYIAAESAKYISKWVTQTTFQQCMRIEQLAPATRLHCTMKDYRRALVYFTRAIESTRTSL